MQVSKSKIREEVLWGEALHTMALDSCAFSNPPTLISKPRENQPACLDMMNRGFQKKTYVFVVQYL